MPHPGARRKDEAAGCGPELSRGCLGAAGRCPGRGGLDVHVELAGLLIVEIGVTGGKAGGLRRACAAVKEPSRSRHRAHPPLPAHTLQGPTPSHLSLLATLASTPRICPKAFAQAWPALTSKLLV